MRTTTEKRYLKIEKQFRVKTYEVDLMGIVSNIVYIKWFEDLRLEFLDRWLPIEKLIEDGISPVLTHTEVHYKHPVRIQNRPHGLVWVEQLGKAKWELGFEFYENNIIYCTGKQAGYFVDLKKYRPVPIPMPLREVWEKEKSYK